VNPYDWHFMRGTPYVIRVAISGLRKPKVTRLGHDVAGEVEAIGKNVTQFKPGDAVFGSCAGVFSGSFAEYARTPESALVLKPGNVTFEQAASLPIAALTALQSLRDKGHIRAGQKVLVNGAAGGVGTFAVQLAKTFGAHVTGVCSTRNVEMVRSIGADHVVDYTNEDFTRGADRYDLILDAVGNRSLPSCRRVLTPKGILVMAGGEAGRWMIGALVRGISALLISRTTSQKMVGIFAKMDKGDLTFLAEQVAAREITPVIDRRYSLRELAQAIGYLEEGHARGKVVITCD
jgi:NADPH:quinone reductase-like Zn-dependent oxidoreductase